MRNILITLIILLVGSQVTANNFKYKAEIEPVDTSDFYKIKLSPEIIAQLKRDWSDIRLYNNETELPYILNTEQHITEQELFVEYPIISKQHYKQQRYTRIIIHNPQKTSINNIVVKINNADVRKKLKLNGSYNKAEWYVIKDGYNYNSIPSVKGESEIRVLNFPDSNYEYYELLIDDYYDRPINITGAGYYNRVKESGKYTQLRNIPYHTIEKEGETIMSIPLNNNHIDKIAFDIIAPEYYLRNARLYYKTTADYKKKKRTYEHTIKTIQLISNSEKSYMLNNFTADTLYIAIANLDDAPLRINAIKLFQLNKYMLAKIEPGHYHLAFGNAKATKPKYDLKHFADRIPQSVKTIYTKPVQYIAKSTQDEGSNNKELSRIWLWVVIIAVAGLLFYMSVKILNDKKE